MQELNLSQKNSCRCQGLLYLSNETEVQSFSALSIQVSNTSFSHQKNTKFMIESPRVRLRQEINLRKFYAQKKDDATLDLYHWTKHRSKRSWRLSRHFLFLFPLKDWYRDPAHYPSLKTINGTMFN